MCCVGSDPEADVDEGASENVPSISIWREGAEVSASASVVVKVDADEEIAALKATVGKN